MAHTRRLLVLAKLDPEQKRVLGVNATARASLYVYNDTDDVEALVDALEHTADFFTHDKER